MAPGGKAPSHYLNQCWNIVNLNLRDKLLWNLKRNSYIFIQENAFQNVVWELASICLGLNVLNWISLRVWYKIESPYTLTMANLRNQISCIVLAYFTKLLCAMILSYIGKGAGHKQSREKQVCCNPPNAVLYNFIEAMKHAKDIEYFLYNYCNATLCIWLCRNLS